LKKYTPQSHVKLCNFCCFQKKIVPQGAENRFSKFLMLLKIFLFIVRKLGLKCKFFNSDKDCDRSFIK